MNEKEVWEREYADRDAIPSSRRSTPSRAVRALAALLDRPDTVLDIGCGNARNALFFAEQGCDVTAVDFSDEAVDLARSNVEQAEVAGSVEVRQENVFDGLSLPDASVDLVVDAYVSCHFLDSEEWRQYWEEIGRVLDDDGAVLWVGMSREDGYYAGLEGTHEEEDIVVDPLNGVAKRLYGREDIETGLVDGCTARTAIDLAFQDTVDGEAYRRRVLGAVLAR